MTIKPSNDYPGRCDHCGLHRRSHPNAAVCPGGFKSRPVGDDPMAKYIDELPADVADLLRKSIDAIAENERLRAIVTDLANADDRYVGNTEIRGLLRRAREAVEVASR